MKQILTKRTALQVTEFPGGGVHIERHSWLTRRSVRKPDGVNVACFDLDELRPLAAALVEEAERQERERGGTQ